MSSTALARMAVSEGLPDTRGDGLAALGGEQVVRWLRDNKYPLLAVVPNAPEWLLADPAFAAAAAADAEWLRTQRDEYARVVEAWRLKGIHCLMIKSAGNFPSFPYTSDNIDVLVRPQDGAAARDTLRQMGYVELRNIEEPKKYLFRKFRAGRSISAIHVHEEVIWLVGFIDHAVLWQRMRPAPDDALVMVPSPEDAILINLSHACYENKRLRLNDLARVRHALRTAGTTLDWPFIERIAAGRGWLEGLAFMTLLYGALEEPLFGSALLPPAVAQRCERLLSPTGYVRRELDALRRRIAAAPVELPLPLSFAFCKRLYYQKVLADPTLPRLQRARDVVSTLLQGVKLKSRLRPQPGVVVAISGPDGSGKTAHARALAEALQLCEVNATYFWARGGSTGMPGAAGRLWRGWGRHRQHADQAVEDTTVRRRRRLSNPALRLAWAWLVAADQALTYGLRARLPALAGYVVVCDRYAYDAAVEMDAALPAGARWSRLAIAAMLAAVPRPDEAYLLDVSAGTARRRKPGEPWHQEWEVERSAYGALARRFGLRTLSTEGQFAESNDPLIREVMMQYMAAFETPLNALFMANPSQRNLPDPYWTGRAGRGQAGKAGRGQIGKAGRGQIGKAVQGQTRGASQEQAGSGAAA